MPHGTPTLPSVTPPPADQRLRHAVPTQSANSTYQVYYTQVCLSLFCWFAHSAQVEAGADILQVFEAMGGFISEDHFYDRAMPYLERYEGTPP